MTIRRIGILGSGVVGRALTAGFVKYGYDVMVGTNHPEKLKDWPKELVAAVKMGGFAEAADYGELVVVAVRGRAAQDVVSLVRVEVEQKTVIDAANPISDEDPEDGVLKFFTRLDESLMERLQQIAPRAHFVKAFNSVGSAFMVDPDFDGTKPTMFICGNDDTAKDQVRVILEQFGWEIEDMGSARAARAIEPLCMLWCIPGFLKNDWSHAFKLLKK